MALILACSALGLAVGPSVFEECMLASAEAVELEEDLAGVEATVGDLITAEEVGDMAGAGKTWDFEPSLMMKDMIKALEQEGFVGERKARPSQGETVPKP